MRFFRLWLVAAAILLGPFAPRVRAQAPLPGNYSAPRYAPRERRGVMVATRDGVLLLAEGALRGRNRDPARAGEFNPAQLSTIEPGQICEDTIRFWRATGNLFQRGHRIRVGISSSWYPYFLPNLNSGADNLAMVSLADAVVARQAVHHGPLHPSHILLPVIPRRETAR